MKPDVNVILADMPASIPAYSTENSDLTYTIVLNTKLNFERQLVAYCHEMNHIEYGDYDRKSSADEIERYAHAI